MNVVKVTMPIPPAWISTRITTWPSGEKSLPVERTVSPVTQVALVAVNRPSRSEIGSRPGTEQIGAARSNPPATITAA